MPHLILEVTERALPKLHWQGLVDAVHSAAHRTGLFDPSHVRTRVHPVDCFRTGIDDKPFIHGQLRIKPGRDVRQKQALSSAVLAAIRDYPVAGAVITVEVVDFDLNSYAKYVG